MIRRKIGDKLEKRLDSYAINYAIAKNKEERKKQNKRIISIARRLQNIKPRLAQQAIKYYKQSRKDAKTVKERLISFAENYNELRKERASENAIKNNDQGALELIAVVFCGGKRNILRFFEYYTKLKEEVSY